MANSLFLRCAYSFLLSSTIALVSAPNAAGDRYQNIISACLIGAAPTQDPQPTEYQLDKIDLEGLQKVKPEKVIEISGLKTGQRLRLEDINRATDKLYASGLFSRVTYRYSWTGDRLHVVFRFEEAQPPPASPAPEAAKQPVLGRIDFNGLRHFTPPNAIQVSGLTVGNPVDQEQFNAATRRLINSGFFAEVNYSLSRDGDRINVLFAVVENSWNATCRFDNYIWFTQQEMFDAIRKEIPLFDGTAPDNIVIARRIAAVLDQLLQQRGIDRKTDYIADVVDFPENLQRLHQFVAVGPPMPICAVNFPGASPAFEKQLRSRAKPLLGTDYSYSSFRTFTSNSIAQFYRQKGYVRARFDDLIAEPEPGTNKKCKGGVNLTLPVTEGVPYKLGAFGWEGNQVIGELALKDLLGMKKGATADGAKIDKGLQAIKEEYWEKGHIDLKLTLNAAYEETTRIVSYRIVVVEGPSYRMGDLIIKNATESEIKRIQSRWPLAQGAVLNLPSVRDFVRKIFYGPATRMPGIQIRKDPAKQIADLILTY